MNPAPEATDTKPAPPPELLPEALFSPGHADIRFMHRLAAGITLTWAIVRVAVILGLSHPLNAQLATQALATTDNAVMLLLGYYFVASSRGRGERRAPPPADPPGADCPPPAGDRAGPLQ